MSQGHLRSRAVVLQRKLGPIVAAGMPRVAATDSTNPFDRAANRSVFSDRENEIFAACRMKSALSSDDVAQRQLVQADQADQHGRWNSNQESQPNHPVHGDSEVSLAVVVTVLCEFADSKTGSFLARRSMSVTNERRMASSGGG